jgi:hypothetical protein
MVSEAVRRRGHIRKVPPDLLISALQAPPPEVQWLAVIPLSVGVGKWIGDCLDLVFPPLVEGVDWSKLGSVWGGIFGVALYLTITVGVGALGR